MRAALVLAVVALVVATPAAATTIRLKLITSTATPVIDEALHFTLSTRTASGTRVRALARLQILRGSTVVRCWKGGAMVACSGRTSGDWISFRGERRGTVRFPPKFIGTRLTFQATMKVQGQTRNLRAPVTVQPTSPRP